jgi:hypothetical protein
LSAVIQPPLCANQCPQIFLVRLKSCFRAPSLLFCPGSALPRSFSHSLHDHSLNYPPHTNFAITSPPIPPAVTQHLVCPISPSHILCGIYSPPIPSAVTQHQFCPIQSLSYSVRNLLPSNSIRGPPTSVLSHPVPLIFCAESIPLQFHPRSPNINFVPSSPSHILCGIYSPPIPSTVTQHLVCPIQSFLYFVRNLLPSNTVHGHPTYGLSHTVPLIFCAESTPLQYRPRSPNISFVLVLSHPVPLIFCSQSPPLVFRRRSPNLRYVPASVLDHIKSA